MAVNLDGANETDVREDVAAPLLTALGYARGTEADILRELQLKYGRDFLGRKKDGDPPLRGKADYVLAVLGAARWVLEVKAPDVPLDRDAIEQAITYARHPEVAGYYAALLNGRRFTLFHCTQRAEDVPIVDIAVTSPEDLAKQLEGVLSPLAIRRDCSPPKIDLNTPLAPGFRSGAKIVKGRLERRAIEWDCSYPLSPEMRAPIDERAAFLKGYVSHLDGGEIWRDEDSRVRARISWALPNSELEVFALDKRWAENQYISLGTEISTNPKEPTLFEVFGRVSVEAGERIFDVSQWESQEMNMPTVNTFHGQILGWLEGNTFRGEFQVEYTTLTPVAPDFRLSFYELGEFAVEVDPR